MQKEKLEEFLEKVNAVHDQVQKISKGEYNQKEYERVEKTVNTQGYDEGDKRRRKERKKRLKEEKLRQQKMGRSGKGEKDDYLYFCPKCQVEFIIEMEKCARCGKITQTQKIR